MSDSKSFVFRFGDMEVREREFTLIHAGEVLPVQPKIFEVLLFLLRHPQRLITKEELLTAVWGETVVTESSLTRIIALLRRMLGDEIGEPRYIATVPKVGYRFVCPVEVSEDTPAAPAFTNGANPETGSAKGPLPPLPQEAPIRKSRRGWLIYVALLALGLIAIGWYLHRPLPPPRITAYTKITHDGREIWPGGTDGNRIYFTQFSGRSHVAQVSITGGEIVPVPVAVPTVAYLEDVSPDGSSLIVAGSENGTVFDRPQWNASVLGGALHRLPDGLGAIFSPDGKTVAYLTETGDLWLVQSDGSGARKLANVGKGMNYLAWSPDGSTIRITDSNRLLEISSKGTNLHEVLPGWHCSPGFWGRWTADGKFFLFHCLDVPTETEQIWALDERRRLFRQSPRPVQLTTGPMRWGWLVPGKDGGKFIAAGTILRGELSRYDAQTKHFLPFLGGISAGCVSFSRDGKSVVYVLFPEGTLWRANRDGSNPVQLTDPPLDVSMPSFSPDGAQILFQGNSQGRGEMYILSASGGGARRILPEDEQPEGDPQWSSDGKEIVFGSGSAGDRTNDLRIVHLDSRQVTDMPGSNGLFSPRWSPDGRFIAALSSNSHTLKVFDTRTQKWSTLLDKRLSHPAWSKDSRWIYFAAADDRAVERVAVTGGQAERIAELKDLPTTGWQGWMALDPEDAPMVMRDVSSQDIYALTLETN